MSSGATTAALLEQHPFDDSESKCTRSDEEVAKQLLNNHDAFVFDMDGVLWRGGQLIEGSPEAIRYLWEDAGKLVFFATNNSTASPQELRERFKRLGFGSFPLDHFYCTAWVAAGVLREKRVTGKVLVLGTEPLAELISQVPGVEVVSLANRPATTTGQMDRVEIDRTIRAVVIGFDPFFCYYRLAYAAALLNELPPDQCLFVATNEDINFPAKRYKLAGAGTLVKSLAIAVNRQPTICGKPSTLIADYIIQRHGLRPERVCMVGDNLMTDIAFGQKAKFTTLLVETGAHTRDDVERLTGHGISATPDAAAGRRQSELCTIEKTSEESVRLVHESAVTAPSPNYDNSPTPAAKPDFILPSLGTIMCGRATSSSTNQEAPAESPAKPRTGTHF